MAVFVGTYVRAFLFVMLVGALGVAVVVAVNLVIQAQGQPRPTISPTEGYLVDYKLGPGPFMTLSIDADGRACDSLQESSYLERVCILATNLDPRVIAGTAFGRLNVEDTDAYEAIVWRARIESDPSLCENGGLLGERLDRCRLVVQGGPYTTVSDEIIVRVSGQ